MMMIDAERFKILAHLPGIKIIDSSLLESHVGNEWKTGIFDIKKISLENVLYSALEQSQNYKITFPYGTVQRFISLKEGVCRGISTLQYFINKGAEKTDGDEAEEILKGLEALLKKSEIILKNVLKKNPTERYIVSEKWQSTFLPAVTEIKEQIDEVSGKIPLTTNNCYNFAKALEVSKKEPTFLVVGNGDFKTLYQSFYEKMDLLAKKYGLEISENPLYLISAENDSLLLTVPLEKPKHLSEKEVQELCLLLT